MSESCSECGKVLVPDNIARGLCHRPCYQRVLRRGEIGMHPRYLRPSTEVAHLVEMYFKAKEADPTMTRRKFCTETGMAYGTLHYHLAKRGLTRTQKDHDALVEDYWMLRSNGGHELTMIQIAAKLGVSDMTLYRALRKVEYEW